LHDQIIIHTDGGSRGNPGPGAAAFVITTPNGDILNGKGVFLGRTTNNIAEYTGLLEALVAAKELNAEKISVFSDSELMVKQINGQYKVKSPNLIDLYQQCVELLSGFSHYRINHVRREKNQHADALANRVMDERTDIELKPKPQKNKTFNSKPIRLGVLISGGGSTMENIQKEIKAGNLNAQIAVVISSRSKVKGVELTEQLGLKLEVVRKKDFPDIQLFSKRLEEVLNHVDVDLVIQAGWLCLWKIPKKYENKVMNIHPALLPSFGGEGMWGHNVHKAVLEKGCKVSGCTVHFCTDEYDKGAIVVQRCCPVKTDDNTDSLAERVFEQECIAYPQAIGLFAAGKLVIENGTVKIK